MLANIFYSYTSFFLCFKEPLLVLCRKYFNSKIFFHLLNLNTLRDILTIFYYYIDPKNEKNYQ